jgi:hypothetical protein
MTPGLANGSPAALLAVASSAWLGVDVGLMELVVLIGVIICFCGMWRSVRDALDKDRHSKLWVRRLLGETEWTLRDHWHVPPKRTRLGTALHDLCQAATHLRQALRFLWWSLQNVPSALVECATFALSGVRSVVGFRPKEGCSVSCGVETPNDQALPQGGAKKGNDEH